MTRKYTRDEIVRLVEGYRRNEPVASIAAAIGRTQTSVAVKAHALRLQTDERGRRILAVYNMARNPNAYRPEEIARLIEGTRRGETSEEIGRALGRSAVSVRVRARMLRESGEMEERPSAAVLALRRIEADAHDRTGA